jgi:type III secretion system FlhB-like substrate exporter
VVGVIDASGHVVLQERLVPGAKAEGISARLEDGLIQVLLVTDADDASVPASLYSEVIASD